MNVLQITAHPTYPPQHGGAHRNHGMVESFPNYGSEVYRIVQGGDVRNYLTLDLSYEIEIKDNYTESCFLNPLYDLTSLPVIFGYPYVFIHYPFKLFSPKQLKSRIGWADVIIVEGPWQVPAVASQVEQTPVVYSSHNMETDRLKSVKEKRFGHYVHRLVVKREKEAVNVADLIVCTSEIDANKFRSEFDFDTRIEVLPNGTYQENISYRDTESDGTELRAELEIPSEAAIGVFVGSNAEANVDGIHELLKHWDSSLDRTHIVIVGQVCEDIKTSAENVTLTGFVEDLDPYFDMADACLNPITWGGGSNIKMFDYLASGVPTITTQFGARGLNIDHMNEAVISDITDFQQRICDSVENKLEFSQIGDRGRKYVEKNYTWDTISQRYHRILDELA